jgi:hypothetical protein
LLQWKLQTWPQEPQLLLSEERSTHAWPQTVWPVGQWHAPQTPRQQSSPPEQTSPQAPQLLLSLPVSTHWPPHSVVPLGHWQLLLTQVWPPEQIVPHVRQLLLSLLVSTHWPPQVVNPVLQVKPHVLLTQVAVAWAGGVQQLLPHLSCPLTQPPDALAQTPPVQARGVQQSLAVAHVPPSLTQPPPVAFAQRLVEAQLQPLQQSVLLAHRAPVLPQGCGLAFPGWRWSDRCGWCRVPVPFSLCVPLGLCLW